MYGTPPIGRIWRRVRKEDVESSQRGPGRQRPSAPVDPVCQPNLPRAGPSEQRDFESISQQLEALRTRLEEIATQQPTTSPDSVLRADLSAVNERLGAQIDALDGLRDDFESRIRAAEASSLECHEYSERQRREDARDARRLAINASNTCRQCEENSGITSGQQYVVESELEKGVQMEISTVLEELKKLQFHRLTTGNFYPMSPLELSNQASGLGKDSGLIQELLKAEVQWEPRVGFLASESKTQATLSAQAPADAAESQQQLNQCRIDLENIGQNYRTQVGATSEANQQAQKAIEDAEKEKAEKFALVNNIKALKSQVDLSGNEVKKIEHEKNALRVTESRMHEKAIESECKVKRLEEEKTAAEGATSIAQAWSEELKDELLAYKRRVEELEAERTLQDVAKDEAQETTREMEATIQQLRQEDIEPGECRGVVGNLENELKEPEQALHQAKAIVNRLKKIQDSQSGIYAVIWTAVARIEQLESESALDNTSARPESSMGQNVAGYSHDDVPGIDEEEYVPDLNKGETKVGLSIAEEEQLWEPEHLSVANFWKTVKVWQIYQKHDLVQGERCLRELRELLRTVSRSVRNKQTV